MVIEKKRKIDPPSTSTLGKDSPPGVHSKEILIHQKPKSWFREKVKLDKKVENVTKKWITKIP